MRRTARRRQPADVALLSSDSRSCLLQLHAAIDGLDREFPPTIANPPLGALTYETATDRDGKV
jgi:hypothetical protein